MDHNGLSWATAHRFMVRPFHEHILPLVYSKIAQSVFFYFWWAGKRQSRLRNWAKPFLRLNNRAYCKRLNILFRWTSPFPLVVSLRVRVFALRRTSLTRVRTLPTHGTCF
jgi:hypothetical protein